MRLGSPPRRLSPASGRLLGAAALLLSVALGRATAQEATPPLHPVPFDAVELEDRFWSPRLATQRAVLVPFALDKTEPAVAYLRATAEHRAGHTPADLPRPHRYVCSDLYKVLEGAAYLLATAPDPALERRIDAIADLIARAQGDDGYLYCAHLLGHGSAEHMMGDGPYRYVLHSHELYNVGHLYEAAVAYHRATGKRNLLDAALKNARHVARAFFEGDPAYNDGTPIRQAPGHEEIELALVRLAEEAHDPDLLAAARSFLEIRGVTHVPSGEGVMSPRYAQQHAPVAQQREPAGHAVRAAYLYTAMADVDAAYGTDDYTAALDAIWSDLVDTRMHLTGGLGATHGIEGFGAPYELPNADTYNETCAAVGNVLWNLRMFRLHREARYLDVAEIALLNGALAGVALSGDRFFYVNPLEADGHTAFNHGRPERSPWFGTACCPTNLARLLPQVPGMLFAHDGDQNLWVTMYAGSRTRVTLGDVPIELAQRTGYPLDGRIELTVSPAERRRFALRLRIPTWNGDRSFLPGALYQRDSPRPAGFTLEVDGARIAEPRLEQGFVVVDRSWTPDSHVVLELAMPVQAERADPRVEADRGRVAFTRGPLVLCAEEVDNGVDTTRLLVPDPEDAAAEALAEHLQVEFGAEPRARHKSLRVTLPAAVQPLGGETSTHALKLVPYYLWNNRGTGSMTVWLPTDAALLPKPGDGLHQPGVVAVRASHTFAQDDVKAIADGRLPKSSADTSLPRWTSWPERGKAQTVELDLDGPRTLRSLGLWFYDDRGGVQRPVEWSLETRLDGGDWQPFELYVTDAYDKELDQFNVVHPAAPCRCDALRIRIVPRAEACVGLLEAELAFEDG